MMERIRGKDEGVHKAESLTSQLDDLVKTYLSELIYTMGACVAQW